MSGASTGSGLYALEPTDGSGATLTGVPGEALTPVIPPGDQCTVLLGRDGSQSFQSVAEPATVTEALATGLDDEEIERYVVRLNSGREVRVGARQIIISGREDALAAAQAEFVEYAGAALNRTLQEVGFAGRQDVEATGQSSDSGEDDDEHDLDHKNLESLQQHSRSRRGTMPEPRSIDQLSGKHEQEEPQLVAETSEAP